MSNRINDFAGKYLITRKNHIFLDNVEIFVLIPFGNTLTGVCLNAYIPDNSVPSGEAPIMRATDFRDKFETDETRWFAPILIRPVLYGGPSSTSAMFVLHDGCRNDPCPTEYLKNRYYISMMDDFFEIIKSQDRPLLFQFVRGWHEFDESQVESEWKSGAWEIRSGQDHVAYGINLSSKKKYLDQLKKHAPGDRLGKIEGLSGIVGGLINFSQEIGVCIMANAAHLYFTNETNLDHGEIAEATRMAIAVSERDGSDLVTTMRKYTHQEIIKKYDEIQSASFKLKFLEAYDRQQQMLKELMIVPEDYYHHVARLTFESGRTPAGPAPEPDTRHIERKLSWLGRVVKDRRGA